MKILVVSDRISPFLHRAEIRTICKDVDLIFSCGDLPFDYLEFIVTMLNKPLYYVFGNHDTFLVRHDNQIQTEPAGCINLDQKIFFENNLLIGGLEGSMRYNQNNHQYTEGQMRLKIKFLQPGLRWKQWLYRRPLDIFITHAPPFGIHDGTDICHQGFKCFLNFIKEFKPRYFIHGHTHANVFSSKPEQYGETQIISVYGYKIIDIL